MTAAGGGGGGGGGRQLGTFCRHGLAYPIDATRVTASTINLVTGCSADGGPPRSDVRAPGMVYRVTGPIGGIRDVDADFGPLLRGVPREARHRSGSARAARRRAGVRRDRCARGA